MHSARRLFLIGSAILFPADYGATQGGRELPAPFIPNPYYQNMPVEPGLEDDPVGNGIMGKAPYAVVEGAGSALMRGLITGGGSGTARELYKNRDAATTTIQKEIGELPTFNNFAPRSANQRKKRRSNQQWIPNPDYFREKPPSSPSGYGGGGGGGVR